MRRDLQMAPDLVSRQQEPRPRYALTSSVDAVPGWYGMDVLSVEADWDDESGRTEMRVEVRAQAGRGTRVQPGVVGFSATVLAELPAS